MVNGWTYKNEEHASAIKTVCVGDGNELNWMYASDVVKWAELSLDNFSSPSLLTKAGRYQIYTVNSAINNNATNKFTDYKTGDFTMYLYARNLHLSTDKGCQYGTMLITSPRWSDRFWVGRIWNYQFTNFWKVGG